MTNIKAHPFRRNDERIEIEPVAKRYVKVAYIKATTWRLTTLGQTGEAGLKTVELVWLVVTQIGYGSLSGLKF